MYIYVYRVVKEEAKGKEGELLFEDYDYIVIDGMHRATAAQKLIHSMKSDCWNNSSTITCLVYDNPPEELVLKWAKRNECLQGIGTEKPPTIDHMNWLARAEGLAIDQGIVFNPEAWYNCLMEVVCPHTHSVSFAHTVLQSLSYTPHTHTCRGWT
jgi:hypothetical protein